MATLSEINLLSQDVGPYFGTTSKEMRSERPPMGPTIPYFGKRAPISKSAPRIFFAFVNVFEGFEVSVFFRIGKRI